MKNAIFSLVLGNPEKYKYSLNTITSYAKKYEIPYFICNEQKILFINHYFEKFQCLGLLGEYDRVLCLDGDILITPHARNIFDVYNDADYFYAFHENDEVEHMNRDSWIETYSPNFEWPIYNNRKMYFNSGCVIYSKRHKDVLKTIQEIPFAQKCFSIDAGEQTALNYAIAKSKTPFKSLDHSFNRMDLGQYDFKNDRYQADFIHYAGPCKYGNGNKNETIIKDFENLYGKIN
jgi:lipopolysaccharide biosynthesis glycosyltransferase